MEAIRAIYTSCYGVQNSSITTIPNLSLDPPRWKLYATFRCFPSFFILSPLKEKHPKVLNSVARNKQSVERSRLSSIILTFLPIHRRMKDSRSYFTILRTYLKRRNKNCIRPPARERKIIAMGPAVFKGTLNLLSSIPPVHAPLPFMQTREPWNRITRPFHSCLFSPAGPHPIAILFPAISCSSNEECTRSVK